ncbi:MAG: CotH kinase family protein [Bacteroidota bacterium]
MTRFLAICICLFLSLSSYAQVFNGTGGAISDDGIENLFTLNVTGLTPTTLDTTHGLLTVCVNITHTWDSDLDVQLISPDGTSITLFSGIGGGDDDFINTCLNDGAGISIINGSAPFTGSYSPMDVIGNVNDGQNGNGIWTLRILDTYPFADAGVLSNWSIEFGAHATAPLTIDSTNLPIVIVNTSGQVIVNEPKITANLKIIHSPSGQMNHPTDVPNIYNGYIGIEIRGSYSASLPQKPYGFETRTSGGNNLNVPLLTMPSENDWILQATYNDKTFMRNSLAFMLSRGMGRYAPRSHFCELLINNNYRGLYLLMEKIKRDDNRVDITKLNTYDNTGDSVTGGYIIKVDYHDASNSWLSSFSPINHPTLDVYYVYEEPDEVTVTTQQKAYIQSFFYSLENALYSSSFTNPTTGYRAYLDVPSFIDYLIINELARNNDGFKKSYFFHKDRDSHGGLLKSGPVWDFDWGWKNVNECSIFAATDGSGWSYDVNDCGPDVNSPGWMKRLVQDTTFTNELKCRYLELRSTLLDTTYLFHYIDSVHTLVEGAQARHYQKWPILGINVGTPEIGTQPLTYDGEITKFKEWIKLRLSWLDANMPGNCIPTGLVELSDNIIFRVFPNPTDSKLSVESNSIILSAEIFDLTGRNLLQINPKAYTAELDISSLPSGLYSVRCKMQNGAYRIRTVSKL